MKRSKFDALVYVLVAVSATVSMIPTLFGFFLAFQRESNIPHMFDSIPSFFSGLTLENFVKLYDRSPELFVWLRNSFVVSIAQTVLYILIASMAAFAFARLRFKGRKVLYYLCLVSMVVPGVINLVPNYIIITKMGLYDTLWAMILPGLSSVGGVFLLHNYMMSIPFDYDEAARIDGAGNFLIYRKIILPMCKPILISQVLFTFQSSWNDFLWPLIVTEGDSMKTIASGLYLSITSDTTMKGLLMASAIVSAIPILVIFIFGQKYFVEGMGGGIKG